MISINKALSALFLLISIPLFAQSYHGEVRGLVTDPSHAVIAGAKVTLVDEARHVTRIAVSDGAGIYIFSRVDPTSYRVSVEATSEKSSHKPKELVNTFRALSACAPQKGDARARLTRFLDMSHRAGLHLSLGKHLISSVSNRLLNEG